jgi:hypothetical protein
MRGSPSILEHAGVGDFVRERMLEGVFDVGEQFCFVKKLRRLQSSETGLQIFGRKLCNDL